MEKDKFVLINREALKNLIYRSHCWCALSNCSEIFGYLDNGELDGIMLEYVENTGIGLPDNISGSEALGILAEWDIDCFHEVVEYDKRKND